MSRGVAGGFEHPRQGAADGDLVALADGYVEPVQPRRVLARADHEKARERRAQGRDSLHMIEVMMGQQRMGQPPAEALGFLANSFAVRRVDRRRRAARLVADEQAEIIL